MDGGVQGALLCRRFPCGFTEHFIGERIGHERRVTSKWHMVVTSENVKSGVESALALLGTEVTLKQLRLHLEEKMGTSLRPWKAQIKAASSQYVEEERLRRAQA